MNLQRVVPPSEGSKKISSLSLDSNPVAENVNYPAVLMLPTSTIVLLVVVKVSLPVAGSDDNVLSH
jgi:hypothetical protein